MPAPIVGLHHLTAFVSDPQRNLDFYTEALGLRFVKRTVNFDDPGIYHFYFGDDLASPGTIMTDPDPHVPWSRVEETAAVLSGMGAQVTTQRYPGRSHTVGADEITLARAIIATSFYGTQAPA